MKNIYNLLKKLKVIIMAMLILLPCLPHVLNAQVKVPFTQRTSKYSPEKKIYNIKGDFTMIGNTNLTLLNYEEDRDNSNYTMKYVDGDNDLSTANSSSATLQFTTENNANHNCSEILYAGLYWTGRAHNGSDNPESFIVNPIENHESGTTKEGYLLSISQTTIDDGVRNERLATYIFTPQDGGTEVTFKYTTWWDLGGRHYKVMVKVGTGSETEISIDSDGNEDNPTVTLNQPYVISTGEKTIVINNLQKRRKSNTVNDKFNAGISYGGIELNKRSVKLKHSNGIYSTITANANDIYYPSNTDGNMYSAYAEVTDYVKTHGPGEYTVGNIALKEGNGGTTGFYGGWGMVIVYQNSKMKWRDITIFDGHAYVVGSTAISHELPISGFNTAQNGNINMKLGIVAGEGDKDIRGDYFQIQKLNTNDWVSLSHSSNSTSNFFNSSINTGNNPRTPNLINNTGLDIAMFNIPNENNNIIGNNQTSTRFKYGSTQDTYIIFCMVMGVDAYTPEIEAYNQVKKLNGSPVPPGQALEVFPNQEIEYTLEIRNIGNESVESGSIVIPIPYTAEFVSCSAEYMQGISGQQPPVYDPSTGSNGSIIWNIGNVSTTSNTDNLLARLTYTLKTTGDCFILSNPHCSPSISIDGDVSGKGTFSEIEFKNKDFIQGYKDGECEGEPITDPVNVGINSTEYVSQNCNDGTDYTTRKFFYCNITENFIPFSEVTGSFPRGSRYYNKINETTGEPTSDAIEYTSSTNFPKIEGINTYYAIPPGNTKCWWKFTIEVEDISTIPEVPNGGIVNYCIGDIASFLTAIPSDPAYKLFFYTSETGGIPQESITPPTNEAGTKTYWVAEGLSGQCIGKNRAKIEVIVGEKPEITRAEFIKGLCTDAGLTTAELHYLLSSEASHYKIIWDADANAEGFESDVQYHEISASPLIISVPSSPKTGVYKGEFIVKKGNCSDTVKITIDVNPMVTATIEKTDVSCKGASDGSITITAEGGWGTYQYNIGAGWKDENIFKNLNVGEYIVKVRDMRNPSCIYTSEPITITEAENGISATVASTNVTCKGSNDGTITITANGGWGTYEYSIDGTNWSTNNTFTGLTPQIYFVSVRDAQNIECTVTLEDEITITEPEYGISATVASTNVTCKGSSDGTITITATGGWGTYEYSIDGTNWSTNNTFIGLVPNTYSIYIRDAQNNNCTVTLEDEVIITEPEYSISATVASTNVTCKGSNDGTIITTATGGWGTYEYSIDGTNWETSNTFTGLTPDTYTISVRDAQNNECSVTLEEEIIIAEPEYEISATVESTNITCKGNNDGTITITATGGWGMYEYSIDGINWSTSNTFTGLVPQTYTIYVRDAQNNECSVTLENEVTITEPQYEISATVESTNVTCKGDNDGTITITATGGWDTYEYSIDGVNWSTGNTFAELAPDSYTIYIRDAQNNNCTITLEDEIIITEPEYGISATVVATNVTCKGNNDGTITITATGGWGTYEYSIDGTNWSTNNTFTGLTPQIYFVSVRDAQNIECTVTLEDEITITEPEYGISATVASTNVTCKGSSDGTITIMATGSWGTYEYSIDGTNWETNNTFTGLAPQTYTISVRDAQNNECSITLEDEVTITEPEYSISATAASTNVTCKGDNDGTITITASGGWGTYEYSIDGTNWSTNNTFTGLAPDSYTIYVRDAQNNECTVSLEDEVIITEPEYSISATATSTDVTCKGSNDGTITITVIGGWGTYEYSIDGTNWETNNTFTGLAPQTYFVSVRDAQNNECNITLEDEVIIVEPEYNISATAASTNVTCKGNNDGTIIITATGGWGTYEYSIDGINWETNNTFTELAPKTYFVSVRDAQSNNCTITLEDVIITEPEYGISATVASTNVTCKGENDGTITITATGGWGTYEYSINGTNWETNNIFKGLAPDTYTIYVRDAQNNNCTIILEDEVIITEPEYGISATAASTNVTCKGNSDGTITITANGGWGTYEYSIHGNNWETNNTFTELAPQSYVIYVRDAQNNECTTTLEDEVTITEPEYGISATAASTNVTCKGNSDGTITITATGGWGTYEYSIDGTNWSTNNAFTGLAPDTYSVYIRDAQNNECAITLENVVIITEPESILATATSTNVTCKGNNDGTITISVTGGAIPTTGNVGTYEYSIDGINWSSSNTFTGLAPKTYFVSVRDAQNTDCAITLEEPVIIEDGESVAFSFKNPDIICQGFGINLNQLELASGDTSGVALTFFEDEQLSKPIHDTVFTFNNTGYQKIYIKGTSRTECSYVTSIDITVAEFPRFSQLPLYDTVCAGNVLGKIDPPSYIDPYNVVEGENGWNSDGEYFYPETHELTVFDDGRRLYYELSTLCGTITSGAIVLNVVDKPSIENFTQIPTLPVGGLLEVEVQAVDNGKPITNYEWYIDETILLASGTDKNVLNYTIQSLEDDGRILTAKVYNGCGVTTSAYYYTDTTIVSGKNPQFPQRGSINVDRTPLSVGQDFEAPQFSLSGPYYFITSNERLLSDYKEAIKNNPEATIMVRIPSMENALYPCKVFAELDENSLGESRTIFIDEGTHNIGTDAGLFAKNGLQVVGASTQAPVLTPDVTGNEKIRYNFTHSVLLKNLVFDGADKELDNYFFHITGGIQCNNLMMDNLTFRNIGSEETATSSNKSVLYIHDGDNRDAAMGRYFTDIKIESAKLNPEYSIIELNTVDGTFFKNLTISENTGNDYAISITNDMNCTEPENNTGNRKIIFAGELNLPEGNKARIQQFCSRNISFPEKYRFTEINTNWIPRDANSFAIEVIDKNVFNTLLEIGGKGYTDDKVYYDLLDAAYVVKEKLDLNTQFENIYQLQNTSNEIKNYMDIYSPYLIKLVAQDNEIGNFTLPYFGDGYSVVNIICLNNVDDTLHQAEIALAQADGGAMLEINNDVTDIAWLNIHNVDYSQHYTLYDVINKGGNKIANAYPSSLHNSRFKAYTQSPEPLMLSVYDVPTGAFANDTVIICKGEEAELELVLLGGNLWDVVYTTDGGITTDTIENIITNPYRFKVKPDATTTYTLVSIADTNGVNDTVKGSAVVIVNDMPDITNAQNFVYCYQENAPSFHFAGNTSGATYHWERLGGHDFGLQVTKGRDSIPAFTAENTGIYPLIAKYSVHAKNTRHGITCRSTAESFLITVNPLPQLATVENKVYCNGTKVPEQSFTGNVHEATYVWNKISGDNINGLPTNGNNSLPAFDAINDRNSVITANYKVTADYSYANKTCNNGDTVEFSISILPTPKVDISQPHQTLCSGDELQEIAFTGAATTYKWERTSDYVPGLPSSGTGNIPRQILTNIGTNPVKVTYKAIPVYEFNGTICEGEPKLFSITVNPQPQINTIPEMTYCSGQEVATYKFGENTETTYSWERTNGEPVGIPDNGRGSLPRFIAKNNGTDKITAEYTVTAEYTIENKICSRSEVFEITLVPQPKVDAIPDVTICNYSGLDISFSGVAETYQWEFIKGDTIGIATKGEGNISYPNVYVETTKPLKATYRVTPLFEDCTGETREFSITLNPEPRLTGEREGFQICSGEAFSYSAMSSIPESNFSWERIADTNINNGEGKRGYGNVINEVLTNNSNQPVTVTYEFTLTSNGCTNSNTDSVRVEVLPMPEINFPFVTEVCAGVTEAIVNYTTSLNTTLQYKLIFSDEALAEGFQNMENYETLPADAFIINIPASVKKGSYAGEIYIYNENCERKYPFSIKVSGETRIVKHPQSQINLCENISEILLSVEAEGDNLTYQWYYNENVIANETAATYKTDYAENKSGYYYVEITSSCGDTLVSEKAEIRTNSITVEQKWDDVLFVRNQDYEYASYQWYKDGKAIQKDGKSQYYTDPKGFNGEYHARAFYADGVTFVETCPVSITMANGYKVSVYPNPALKNDRITLKIETNIDEDIASQVDIFDVLGRKVYSFSVTERLTTIPADLHSGSYVIQVTNQKGKVTTHKLIVK